MDRGGRTPRGAGDRSADTQMAVRLAPPPASSRLRLGSGPRIPDRRALRGHEAVDLTPAPSGATSAPQPGGFYSFPVTDSPRRERCKLGGSPRHRQPLPGVGTATRVLLSGAAPKEPGRCPRCDPASTNRAAAMSPRPLRGTKAEGGGGGGSRGFLGSFCPEEPALERRGPPEGRGDTATDTCLQGSAPARAALGAGPPPRGRVGGDARASQPGSSSCSSSSSPAKLHRLPWVLAPVPSG